MSFLLCAVWFLGFVSRAATYDPCSIVPPKPLREFRGAWVATVANIDWPSKPGLTTSEQKAELIAILNRAAQLKLNAIIFQVRPSCDALYASSIEPWSEYLTGIMGQAPEPFYDPLSFAVEEAHKRALELHAWFNPYRAHHNAAKSPISANHISKTRPQLVRQYGKFLWLDPGEKEVQDYSLSVMLDVVKRYDIDGVHIDDYFYPYKETDAGGQDLDFPDDPSWKRASRGVPHSAISRDDWRRENVNTFIERAYQSIKAIKPWVKFGISPFGIWRPGNPRPIEGYDAYAKLYADSRKWLVNGWLDYCAPQLYWAIEDREHSFPVLLKWWTQQNPKGRLVLPGLNSSQTSTKWKPEEITAQIRLAQKQRGVSGHIHWSMKSLMRNSTLAELLQKENYREPALIPATPWLERAAPGKPEITVPNNGNNSKLALSWHSIGSEHAFLWLLQTRIRGKWTTEVLPGKATSRTLNGTEPEVIALTSIDRTGNASAAASLKRREK